MIDVNVNDALEATATATDPDSGETLTFDFLWSDQTAGPTTIRETLGVLANSPALGTFVATDQLPVSLTTVGQVIKLSVTSKDSTGLVSAAMEMPIRIVGNAPVMVSLTVAPV